jgi:uncharacterized repeat protein (TIGR01451 family)
MFALQNSIKKYTSVFLFVLLLCFSVFAQEKFDLDVKVQPASETARGGETFSYSITVGNIGSAKATDVILIQDEPQSARFVSFAPSKGNCEIDENRGRGRRRLRCRLNDIEPSDSIIILVEVKINEFGDVSENVNSEKLPSISSSGSLAENYEETFEFVDVWADREEENDENNHAKIIVKLLPSKNIPPRLQIVSPKNELAFIKPLNKQLEIPIVIKAFDIDGRIKKVVISEINDGKVQFIFEDNEPKYLIAGITYSEKEIEEKREDEEFIKSIENRASLTGKDTYTYIAKNFHYGRNTIRITAFDETGRSSLELVELDIKRDASIEIISPKLNQVFAPDSTITIETVSKINDSQSSLLRLDGTRNNYFYPDYASIPLLQPIFKAENTFKHQYIWKNVPEGIYNLRVLLFEGEEYSQYEEMTTIIVAEPRVIKIVSLKNGQQFEAGKNIEIKVEARDKKGQIVHDKMELFVDGKSYIENIDNSLCEGCFPNSYNLQSSEIKSGTHTIQIIAKYQNGIKSGESELMTIVVK